VFAGGLRGAGKAAALAAVGVDESGYLAVSIDRVLGEMARRSLIPVAAGLSPLEGADLVHTEAQHIAKRLTARAVADGRNLLLDVTMASEPSVRSWLVNLGLACYAVQVVITPFGGEDAARWAEAEQRRGQQEYDAGRGDGGRYVPREAILAAGWLAGSIAGSDWPAILRNVASQQQVAFPSGPVFSLVREYAGGRLTLPELAQRLRTRGLPAGEAACPPGLEQARAAIDDLEPWTSGSFDEVVLGTDLGLLSDDDYEHLATAITGG
jgi:hypothetical protein